MADIWMDVDAALSEVPVNILPLLDDTDFKSIEASVAYNAAGMALKWNFVDTAGNMMQTAVTPTTSGTYDWVSQGNGMYSIEIPASGGASINNDTEGFGWFTGVATGVLPWRGPIVGFRAAALNNSLIDAGTTGLLAPTTAARTLDVSAGGEAGVDWANVGSPTTSLALTGTTIAVTQKVDVDTIKTNPVVNGGTITFPSNATVASTTGAVGSVTGAVGSVTGAVGSVTGAVGSVTGAVGSIAAGGITDASFAAGTGRKVVRANTAAAGAAGTITLDAAASATDSIYNGLLIYLTGGTGAGQARTVTAYVGSTQVATVDRNWQTNPDNTTTFALLAADAAKVDASLQVTVGAYPGNTAQTGDSYARLGAPAGASLSADVAAVKVDTAAVKVQTDKLAFTVTNQVDANVLDWKSATAPAMTGDAFARLGAPAGASVSADIAAAKVDTAAIKAKTDNMPEGVKKNTALAAFEFFMADSSDHVTGKTGLAITATRSIDGAAFGACTNSATEVASGIYAIDLAAADLNGTVITLKFTAAAADATLITIKTTL